MPVAPAILHCHGCVPTRACAPVIDMITNSPEALSQLAERRAPDGKRSRGRPPCSPELLWACEIHRRACGLSVREAARQQLEGASNARVSRPTLQRFATRVDADPLLSRLARAAEAHGCARRNAAGARLVRELDIQRAAFDCPELLAELDPSGRRGPARIHQVEALLRAFVVMERFGIGTLAELRRRFEESSLLSAWCGFTAERLPSRSTLSRFRTRLAAQRHLLVPAQQRVLREIRRWEPSFGTETAIDCTFVAAWSNGRRKQRSDSDARFGHSTKNRGRMQTEVDLGYKLHFAACALTDVPAAVIATPADVQETIMLRPLLGLARSIMPGLELLSVSADKGYDSRANTDAVMAEGAEPVIQIRNMPRGRPATDADGVNMDREGTPFCPDCGELMRFVAHTGHDPRTEQRQAWSCSRNCGADRVLVRWSLDPRRTPYWPRAAPESRRRKRAHQAIERCNSRLKTPGDFITGHRARGLHRISLLAEFAALMMQARALAAYRDGRADDVRRRVLPVG